MKGIRFAILFSSLIFSTYAEDNSDTSNLLSVKGYFPTDEGTTPGSVDDDSYKQKKNSKSGEKKWTPESNRDGSEADSSLLLPKAEHEDFFGQDK